MAEISGSKGAAAPPKKWYETHPIAGETPAGPERTVESTAREALAGPAAISPSIFAGAPKKAESEGKQKWYEAHPEVITASEGLEQLEVGAKSLVGGIAKGSGTLLGARIGAVAGAPLGPFVAAGGALAGGTIGFLAGTSAEKGLADFGLATDPQDEPAHLRPMGIFAETLGMGASMTAQVRALATLPARLPDSVVGRVGNAILDMARDKPKQFLAGEASAQLAASTAEGIFEAVVPGQELARTGVGVAAGVVNPGRLAAKYSVVMFKGLKDIGQRLTAAGRQSKAGETLLKFLAAADEGVDAATGAPIGVENPAVLMRLLADNQLIADSIPGFGRSTAAQTTGDVRLAQLEAELGRHNEAFGQEITERADESLNAIANAIALLRGTGDPGALVEAARLHQVRYQMALDGLLEGAQRDAVLETQRIPKGMGSAELADASAEASRVVYTEALVRARNIEEGMWTDAVAQFGDVPATPSAVRRVFAALKNEEKVIKVPVGVQKQIEKFAAAAAVVNRADQGLLTLKDGTKITKTMVKSARKELSVRSMHQFRSDMLLLARGQERTNAAASVRFERWYGLMASAALDDMTRAGAVTKQIPGELTRRGARGRFTNEITSMDEARDFSRQIADTFTRSFVGEGQQVGAYGLKIPPESLLTSAFASGGQKALRQLDELEQAVRFLPPERFRTPELMAEVQLNADTIMDAQSRLLSITAGSVTKEVTDPATGITVLKTDLTAARNFLKRNDQLLEKFPSVKESLEAATESQIRLDQWAAQIRGAKRINDASAIASLLKVEDPSRAIQGALNSPRPLEALDELANLANGSGEAAKDGFRRAIFQHLINRAEISNSGGKIQLNDLVNGLFDPIHPGAPSVLKFMIQKNIFPQEQVDRLKVLVDAASRVMVGVEAKAVGEQILDPTSVLETVLVRAMGSEIGRRALRLIQPPGAGSSGPTLIVAYQAAQAAQTLINRMPGAAVNKFIMDALTGEPLQPHPGLFERLKTALSTGAGKPLPGQKWSLLNALVNPGTTPFEKLKTYEQLHAYMWSTGLLSIEDDYTLDNSPGLEVPFLNSFRGEEQAPAPEQGVNIPEPIPPKAERAETQPAPRAPAPAAAKTPIKPSVSSRRRQKLEGQPIIRK